MKTLLIVSSGRCAWDDIAKAKKMLGDTTYDTLGVNHMVMFFPDQLDHAVSWHSDLLFKFVNVRVYRKILNRPITYAPRQWEGIDNVGRFHDGDVVTSGMYAAYVGLHLGYDKIVLAGIPFDNTGHFYDPPETKSMGFNYSYPQSKAWDKLRDNSGNKIRAVSGSLIKCFGELTGEWLSKEREA